MVISNCSKNATDTEKWQERLDIVWWLVGFVDGEGTFSVSLFRNKTSKSGWQIFPEFVITQGEKSLSALLTVKEFFGCGYVYVNRRNDSHRENLYRYCVRSRKDLKEKIVPFFGKYKLKTAKYSDFGKFSKILYMLDKNMHKEDFGMRDLAKIIEGMNRKKKSQYLKSSEAIRQAPI